MSVYPKALKIWQWNLIIFLKMLHYSVLTNFNITNSILRIRTCNVFWTTVAIKNTILVILKESNKNLFSITIVFSAKTFTGTIIDKMACLGSTRCKNVICNTRSSTTLYITVTCYEWLSINWNVLVQLAIIYKYSTDNRTLFRHPASWTRLWTYISWFIMMVFTSQRFNF